MRASPWFRITLTVLISVIPAITAFLASPLEWRSLGVRSQQPSLIMPMSPRRQSRLYMSVMVSTDPFQVLNLSPTSDKKKIKRAYRLMASKYHPDVVTNRATSAEARKKANDEFKKINWAYAQLTGKSGAKRAATSTSSSSTSSSSHSPHCRTSNDSYTYNPYQVSTDWQDYVYNPFHVSTDWQDFMFKHDDQQVYDKQVYNEGGDSFDKIISDIFEGATIGAACGTVDGRGIFRDFVERLQSNVNGYSKEVDNVKLRTLLKTGSVDEVGKEMDDAELLVQQMDLKRRNLASELFILEAHLIKKGLVEKVGEVEARKQVVDGNIKKARKWLLALQTRHNELLLVRGDKDVHHKYMSKPGFNSFIVASAPALLVAAAIINMLFWAGVIQYDGLV